MNNLNTHYLKCPRRREHTIPHSNAFKFDAVATHNWLDKMDGGGDARDELKVQGEDKLYQTNHVSKVDPSMLTIP